MSRTPPGGDQQAAGSPCEPGVCGGAGRADRLGAPGKTQVVGNPVRPEVFAWAGRREEARAKLKAGDRTVILSFGGSLGARRINEVVADLCAWEQKNHKNVLHLHATTGQDGVQLFKDLEQQKGFSRGESLEVRELHRQHA